MPLHQEDDTDCWCQPHVLQVCPVCNVKKVPGCLRCTGLGLVPMYSEEYNCVIKHHDEDADCCVYCDAFINDCESN